MEVELAAEERSKLPAKLVPQFVAAGQRLVMHNILVTGGAGCIVVGKVLSAGRRETFLGQGSQFPRRLRPVNRVSCLLPDLPQ